MLYEFGPLNEFIFSGDFFSANVYFEKDTSRSVRVVLLFRRRSAAALNDFEKHGKAEASVEKLCTEFFL